MESGCPTEGEEPPELADEWNRTFAMLWVIGTFVVVGGIVEDWLPKYVVVGVQCFAGGLVYFRFRTPRLRRFSLGKWLALVFLVSVFASLLDLGLSRLWSGLAKLWLLLFKS